ncbi:MAG TPA: ATP-binding cassette domain-containing protein, partial [Candidatus Altiarchaeales archaeon]|nr:ATP-binding cassette domain-containing protein [Candidatus Altiarchaeales archaeon]
LTEKDAVRRSFGIVFQDQSTDEELTCYENMEFHAVLYGLDKESRKRQIKKLLEMVGLWERRDDLVKKFSGGMKRRLEIARGLIHHPKILFLDEPTLGLDPQTRNRIWDHIREVNKSEDMTVFFTTHYMEEAEAMAERIAIIDYGRIVADGTLEEIKSSTGEDSLEKAFLELTGHTIRPENGSSIDRMRLHRRMHR